MIRTLSTAVAVLALLGACSSETRAVGEKGARASASATASGDTSGSGSARTTAKPATGTSRPPVPTLRPDQTPAAGAAPSNKIPFAITLNRRCATPGSAVTATARTLPKADVTMAVRYPDAAAHDIQYNYTPADANRSGTVSWTFVVHPTTAAGPAGVMGVAGRGSDGASFYAPFTIARTC